MVRGLGLNTRSECAPGESRDPFLVLPMPVDALSPILTGVGDYVAEPEHDDGAIKERGRRNRRGQPGGRPKGLPPSRRPTPCADRATSKCVKSPMIELASGKYLLQLSRLPSGLLGINRHLLGTTHEVDDRHDH